MVIVPGCHSSSCSWLSRLLFLVVAVVLFLVGGSVGVGAVLRPRGWDGASAIPLSPRKSLPPSALTALHRGMGLEERNARIPL